MDGGFRYEASPPSSSATAATFMNSAYNAEDDETPSNDNGKDSEDLFNLFDDDYDYQDSIIDDNNDDDDDEDE